MKKFLAIIFSIVAMTILFTGCGDQSKFIGTWETTMDFSDMLNEEFQQDEEMGKYLSVEKFGLVMRITFKDDGTYEMNVDEDAIQESVKNVQEDLKEGFTAYLEQMMKDNGIDMTVEELLAESGTSMDELLQEYFGEEQVALLVDSLASEGNFEVKNGKLFMSDGVDSEIDEDEYETYEINDDKLKLLESFGGDEEEIIDMYPVVFEKVD